MKYQLGDKIVVLHTEEEGTIIDIVNEKMVLIDVKGVKFPAYMDQIDFPYFLQFMKQRNQGKQNTPVEKPKQKVYIDQVKQEKNSIVNIKVNKGVWLSFFPIYDKDIFDDDVIEKLKIYLVNETNEHFNFDYNQFFSGLSEFQLLSEILPFSNIHLHTIPFSDMSDSPRFCFEFTLAKNNPKKAEYFEVNFKWKSKQLMKAIEKSRNENLASFSEILFENYPDKSIDTNPIYVPKGQTFYDLKDIKKNLEPAQSVVDLHIEKLTDRPERLDNGEKLELQLKAFDKYYELAKIHKLASIIFIHGLGSGRLREELHQRLNNKSKECHFFYGYQPNYGMGATEVFLSV